MGQMAFSSQCLCESLLLSKPVMQRTREVKVLKRTLRENDEKEFCLLLSVKMFCIISVLKEAMKNMSAQSQHTEKSHNFTVLSYDPDTIMSSLNCKQVTPSVCDFSVRSLSPVFRLHT